MQFTSHSGRAQSISEYVLAVALVSIVLVGMTIYIKRGIQGVVRDTADLVGTQKKGGMVFDYKNPNYNYKTSSTINETQSSNITVTQSAQGNKTREKNTAMSREGLVSDSISYDEDE